MTANILSTPSGLTLDELKQTLFQNCRYRLGDGIIDLELDPQHYEAAYNYAIKVYRQRAQAATEESYTLFTVEKMWTLIHYPVNLSMYDAFIDVQLV